MKVWSLTRCFPRVAGHFVDSEIFNYSLTLDRPRLFQAVIPPTTFTR
jgi:hypothetical protein